MPSTWPRDSISAQALSTSAASIGFKVWEPVHFLLCRWVGVGVLVGGNTVGGAGGSDGTGEVGNGGGGGGISLEAWARVQDM